MVSYLFGIGTIRQKYKNLYFLISITIYQNRLRANNNFMQLRDMIKPVGCRGQGKWAEGKN